MVALWQHNPIDVEIALRTAPNEPSFPPIGDRAAWEARRARVDAGEIAALIARAEAAAIAPIPALPATLFLEFDRTGQRDGYQDPQGIRRDNLAALVLAECLEDRGRFLDPILDLAWAICEESSWIWPAHQRILSLPIDRQIQWRRREHDTDPMRALPDVERPIIDLGVAGTALFLAECDALVGARLNPMLGKRIRHEVDRRCLTPFLTRHDFHWLHTTEGRGVNNWTAVCICGVVGAATYLEPDPARLAEVIARGTRSLADYLETFDQDGGSSEGPGYWSYGFGHYTVIAHLIERRTGGRVRLLDGEVIRQIARYPLRTVLSPGQYVNFSDCDRDVALIPAHLAFLARRLDLPALTALAASQPVAPREDGLLWSLRSLFWRADAPTPALVTARADFFRGMHWLIARHNPSDADALVLAAKGGHNGEMHNQNDVGTVIVHWNGESLVADPGRGRYTAAYFGPERYDHLVNASRGHSVPVVNGQGQRPGPEYAAELLDHQASDARDLLALELKGAYPPEADLASLRRTIALNRQGPHGSVILEDVVRFASAPGTFESVLITFGEAELTDGSLVLRGERAALAVSYDARVVVPRIERIPDVDLAEGPTDLTRVIFALAAPTQETTVRLILEPLPFHETDAQ
jgi:hypothetical protein